MSQIKEDSIVDSVVEIMEDEIVNDTLVDDYPDSSTIDEWKARYGRVYEIDILENIYIIRGITRNEIRAITNEVKREIRKKYGSRMPEDDDPTEIMQDMMQEMEVRMATLYPDLSKVNFDDPGSPHSPAGIILSLSNVIDEVSGFNMQAIPREL